MVFQITQDVTQVEILIGVPRRSPAADNQLNWRTSVAPRVDRSAMRQLKGK